MVDHYEGEDVIITFERTGASSVANVEGRITSIKLGGGEESRDIRYAFGNKQISFGKPKSMYKIDFGTILSSSSASRMFSQLALGGTANTAGITFKSSSSQDYWRVVIWFVPLSEQKKAGTVYVPPKTSSNLGRWIMCDCKGVTFERDFESDDMLGGTLSLEFSATDGLGYANFFEGYTNSTTSAISPMELTTANVAEYRGTLSWNTTTPAWTGAYST